MNNKIIDAHMHLWNFDSGYYPWLKTKLPGGDKMIGNYDTIRKNYLVNDYQDNVSNVVKSVHIQAFGYPEDPVLETKWLQDQADKFKFPHGIVGYTDLSSSDADQQLSLHANFKNMRGIRNVLCYHDDPDLCMINNKNLMESNSWRDGFSLLEKKNLSFDIQIFDHQLDQLTRLAADYPNIKIMINHFAWPTDLSIKGFKNWVDRIKNIAHYQNVYMKISGFDCVFKKINLETIKLYINKSVEFFSIDRCVWGSNLPVANLVINHHELLKTCELAVEAFSIYEKRKLFYDNASNFYRI